jgi:hypothetical protein
VKESAKKKGNFWVARIALILGVPVRVPLGGRMSRFPSTLSRLVSGH